VRRLLLLTLLIGCAPAGDPPPESDAHAVLDPERDVVVRRDGVGVRATEMAGAEDGEAVSPDGEWVAFVGGDTGIASVWAVRVPAPGAPPNKPVQLTNKGLQDQPRTPGQPPGGFVPPPDHGPLRWVDDRTVAWEAGGVTHTAAVPR
jgi:hypothetical protein